VVKADGYGLGAVQVARRLRGEGARSFFVARVAEGEALRAALGSEPIIYVLDGVAPGAAARLTAADLVPAISSVEQLAEWAAHARGGPALPAALHIDTGMNRLGFPAEEFRTLRALGRLEGVRVALLMSHLACADEPRHALNARQQALFADLRAYFPDAPASLANSAGCFLGAGYAFDLVRPGISLYGGGPRGRTDPRIRQVATLEAPVLQVRDVAPAETVGYGATFTADRPLRAAILAAGYADGIFRGGGSRASAWLHGARRRYLGRVSMDLIAIDVTDAPETRPGDLAQLLGPDVPVDEAAGWAGSLAYELLVRLAPRAERRYLGG
jgi:alanine racemase